MTEKKKHLSLDEFLGKGKGEKKEKKDKPTDCFEVESQEPKEPKEKKSPSLEESPKEEAKKEPKVTLKSRVLGWLEVLTSPLKSNREQKQSSVSPPRRKKKESLPSAGKKERKKKKTKPKEVKEGINLELFIRDKNKDKDKDKNKDKENDNDKDQGQPLSTESFKSILSNGLPSNEVAELQRPISLVLPETKPKVNIPKTTQTPLTESVKPTSSPDSTQIQLKQSLPKRKSPLPKAKPKSPRRSAIQDRNLKLDQKKIKTPRSKIDYSKDDAKLKNKSQKKNCHAQKSLQAKKEIKSQLDMVCSSMIASETGSSRQERSKVEARSKMDRYKKIPQKSCQSLFKDAKVFEKKQNLMIKKNFLNMKGVSEVVELKSNDSTASKISVKEGEADLNNRVFLFDEDNKSRRKEEREY